MATFLGNILFFGYYLPYYFWVVPTLVSRYSDVIHKVFRRHFTTLKFHRNDRKVTHLQVIDDFRATG